MATTNTRKPAATRKPETAVTKLDLAAIGKVIAASDKKVLDNVVVQFEAREKAHIAFARAVSTLVKKHGAEALTKGSQNPKITPDSNAAVEAERKAKKANPLLRYLWLTALSLGLTPSRASNLITEVKKTARGDKPKGKSKSDPSIQVRLIKEPDECTVGIGLKDWLVSQSEHYPTLASFLLPALKECLGDAYDDGGDDE